MEVERRLALSFELSPREYFLRGEGDGSRPASSVFRLSFFLIDSLL